MTSADLTQQNINSLNTSTVDRRFKRRSRTSDTLLATVTALLKVLGVNTSSSKSNRRKRNLQAAGDDTKINNQTDTTIIPAMPKEKASISLSENDYSESQKEVLVSSIDLDKITLNDTNTATTDADAEAETETVTTEAVTTEAVPTTTENDTETVTPPATTAEETTTTPPPPPPETVTVDNTTNHVTTNGVDASGSTQATTTGSNSTPIPHHHTKRNANDFRFGKSIGEGSFSTVYLAKDIHTHREYAIKVCEKQQIIRERKQEYIKREREVMNTMTGIPGFVNLYCTFQDSRNLYFVMTYAKNGDLLPHINKVGSFDSQCTRFYIAEIVLALENMHRNNIIHRDLKPENILLDDKMHVLIADFGSAKILTPPNTENLAGRSNGRNRENVHRERKNSFVGTAQYVSPETLRGKPITKLCDLWALGCIVYQMISGLPPFRASTEYMIFQNILRLELTFPDGFDRDAKDLVERLLQIEPTSRLGGEDLNDKYDSIRSHPFFDGIDWDTIQTQTPPHIYPYLPGLRPDEDLDDQYCVPDHLEPGLDDKQLTRLLGMELGTAQTAEIIQNEPKNLSQISKLEKNHRRIENQKLEKWHPFTDGEIILKYGYVNKRKGLFARKRMLLLTTGPRLIYIDPVQMVKKGEIPWSQDLRVEPKNFKIFFIHTPNRTYYLEDPEGYALHWCQTIDKVREDRYGQKS